MCVHVFRCIDCIEGRYKYNKTWPCDSCGESLKKSQWDLTPIEEQKFKLELVNRQECNKVFILDETDFTTLQAYNDYLETSADILYGLTYGSKSDQLDAKRRLDEYLKTNRNIIEAAKMKKIQLKGEQDRAERNALLLEAHKPSISFNVPSFILPEPAHMSPNQLTPFEAEEKRIQAMAEGQTKNQARWLLQENRRLGGGFKRDEERSRSKKEALDGLWM